MDEAAAAQQGALRVALVGYGGAGRGIHARLVREAGHRVTAVVSRSPERREAARADWPDVVLHDDVAGLAADRAAFDVVVVASPTALHTEHGGVLLRAGVPVVLDKPIALDAGAARALVELAREHDAPLTVFHNRRWDPEQLTLRAVLDSGELGAVHTFERRWERWRPVPQQRWKENDPVGGGLLLDLGPHLVDSATQLFGPVRAVWAELRALSTPTEDDVFLTLHHAARADAPAVVSRLWAGSLVGAPGPRTRVLGSGGAFVVTTFENDASPFEELDAASPAGSEGWLARGRERVAVPRAPGGHADFYRAVAGWVLDGGPVPVDPQDAVRTAQVLDAARLSAREGRLVEV